MPTEDNATLDPDAADAGAVTVDVRIVSMPSEDNAMLEPAAGDTGALTVDVSVLIPVRNEARSLPETVPVMLAQQFDGNVEFLFMDGRSEDDTRAILERMAEADSRIVVLDNPGRSTPDALNVGLARARGEFVARMDAHAHYRNDYLALGVERLRRGDVDWVSGPQVARGEGRWSRRVALALGQHALGTVGSAKWGSRADDETEQELDTGVWLGVWRRSNLEQHGGWDTGWPINQDSELAARTLAAGQRILLLPQMAAEYMPRDTLRGLARQYARYGFYRCKTARRHPHSARRSHMLAPLVALSLTASVGAPAGRTRRVARTAFGAYLGALGFAAARHTRHAAPRDAAGLPIVYAIMHISWGYGYLAGCVRHGPPLRAVAGMLRRNR